MHACNRFQRYLFTWRSKAPSALLASFGFCPSRFKAHFDTFLVFVIVFNKAIGSTACDGDNLGGKE
jgi:hypothetical protein